MTHVKAVTTVTFFCPQRHLHFIKTAFFSLSVPLYLFVFQVPFCPPGLKSNSQDIEIMNGCRSEARTSSSGGESSTDFSQQDLQMTEPMSTEWTDELHSLYLKSMEASFVNQLYNSMDLLDLQMKKDMSDPNMSQQVQSKCRSPSSQFKVLRGGCWQKINFRRPDLQVNIANESQGALISPWIQHFRYARKPQDAVHESTVLQNRATNSSGKKVVSGGSATCSKHSYLCRFNSCPNSPVDSNTEVSDQNFVDENIRSGMMSSSCNSKRIKTQKTGASINDQVVPYGKLPGADHIAADKKDDSQL